MTFLALGIGLVFLVAGGELLVRGAVALAARFGVSPLLIGLTVVGFGTSTPELVTSIQAALAGSPGIAVGNVVGSNIANILLILGVSAVLLPVIVSPAAFRRDGLALIAATIAVVILSQLGTLSRPVGLALIGGLIAYITLAYLGERTRTETAAPLPNMGDEPAQPGVLLSIVLAVGGIALTVWGASLLVGAAVALAERWGVSDAIIGLTIVAVGTSLPELVTSIMAALRRQGDLAFGNVVGSNIYNLLGILGTTALVKPIAMPDSIAAFDVWVMLAVTVALGWVAVTGWKITRGEGALLLAGYAGYLAFLVQGAV
ncbi:calcium/sodium antiporter [Maribius pontilimi]|uniref:Calcium/sodium antiporter n=1 Tax=Palleronia pontilimi TaxID=1964209 RepID=A0A934IJ03_9RHOB|nr:calcium/sodium antiporter [Palleronia pontilimi]MBJ3762809.1 calcium/sodium antiporter [Palleronia pontilimi]